MARKNVRTPVLQYLGAKQGETVFVEHMAVDLDLESRQIQNVMLHLVHDMRHDIDVIVRGQAWIYRGMFEVVAPEPATNNGPDPRLFDEVGTTISGDLIIADQNNRLYRAEPL